MRPELLEQTTEKVRMVRDRMQASQSRQKAYANRRRILESDPNHWYGKGSILKEALS